MKKSIYIIVLLSILLICNNVFAQPRFFGIKEYRSETDRKAYKDYVGKSIVFYDPVTSKEDNFRLKKIEKGLVYRILDVKDEYITVAEKVNSSTSGEPIKIKCYALEYDDSDRQIYNLPCYFYDDFNLFKQKALDRKVSIDNMDYIVSDVIWKESLNSQTLKNDYCPFLVLFNDKDIIHIRIDDAVEGRYKSFLSKVEKPANESIRYGEIRTIIRDSIDKFSYSDNVIDLFIFNDSKQFNFELKNVSEYTIKVVWNEAAFVATDGSMSKVMHKGIKFSQREGDQPSSIIIRGAVLDDCATPTENVYYKEGYRTGRWETKSMYPLIRGPKKNVSLLLPIQIKDTINEYLFIFDVVYFDNYPELSDLIFYMFS